MPQPRSRRWRRAARFAFAAAIGLAGLTASAQIPGPFLQAVSPPGGRAGSAVDVAIAGENLEGVDALWLDDPALVATRLDAGTFRVAIAPDAPPGHHDLRAVGPFGASNPRTFVVGERPESTEVEPNDDPRRASPIAIGATANGVIGPVDVDMFAFEGRQGERVFIEVDAERIDSRLDATIEVARPGGQFLGESRDVFGLDPFLDVSLPETGRYTIRVRDVVYAGSPSHAYRLTLHQGPHLDAVSPIAAPPGVPTEFTLLGRNLGGEPAPGPLVDGRRLEQIKVTLSVPLAGDPPAPTPSVGMLTPPLSRRRGLEYTFRGPNGTSNPVFIAEASEGISAEIEPNDDLKTPQTLELLADVSGTFGKPGDVDTYRVRGRKGDEWRVQLDAERIGSPADPSFAILAVDADGSAKPLAVADDRPDRGGAGDRFSLASRDASLLWKVPEDGEYLIVANDLFNTERGDARLGYRLAIRPEPPGFQLDVVPEAPIRPGGTVVRAGGRALALAAVDRSNGFVGSVRVEATGLPAGVRCEPLVVPEGKSSALLVFEADDSAPSTDAAIGFVGRDVQHPERAVAATAGVMTWPAGKPSTTTPPPSPPARATRGFVLSVRPEAPLAIAVDPPSAEVNPGRRLELRASIVRRAGFAGPVQVVINGLPPQVAKPPAATIAEGATAAVVALFLPKDLPTGSHSLMLRASGAYSYRRTADAAKPTVANLDEPSNAIPLNVRPSLLALSASPPGPIAPGSSADIAFSLDRKGFDGMVRLQLDAPAGSKLAADPVEIAEGSKSGKLTVRVEAGAVAGPVAAYVRAVATATGTEVVVDEPLMIVVGPR